MNLDDDVSQTRVARKPFAILVGSLGIARHDNGLHRENSWTDRPDVKVHQFVVVSCQLFSNQPVELFRRVQIKQHSARRSQEPDRPVRHNDRSQNSHCRVDPDKAEILSGKKSGDRSHRSQRIGDHVQPGRSQIVIMRRGTS